MQCDLSRGSHEAVLPLCLTLLITLKVFSEISKINLDSGRVRIVRKSKSLEAPIESVAPSTTGKYLFIAFRQCQAPELWLIENEHKLLRKFPKDCFHLSN